MKIENLIRMKQLLIITGAILVTSASLVSCGETQKAEEKTVSKPVQDSVKVVTPPVEKDIIYLAEGTYTLDRTNDDPSIVAKKIVAKITGKNKILLNKDEFEFEKEVSGQTTTLKFGLVSEETGDFLGGGAIEITNGKASLTMYDGVQAELESVYKKVD